MSNSISILTVERDGKDGLIVTFSDGTQSGYVVEELLEMRPHRERTAARKWVNVESIDTKQEPQRFG
jgi:hypothetical protein